MGTPETATDAEGVQDMPVITVASAPPETKQLTLIGDATPVKVALKFTAEPPRVTVIPAGVPLIWKSAGGGGVVELPFFNSVSRLYASSEPSPVTRL